MAGAAFHALSTLSKVSRHDSLSRSRPGSLKADNIKLRPNGSVQAALLFHTAAGPWGGPSEGVQFAAVYTEKATGKRYVTPGAAFFQVDGGKIRRTRLFLASDERAEVEPQGKKKPE